MTIICSLFSLKNTDHRYHVNRIIHETLTGNSVYPCIKHPPYEKE